MASQESSTSGKVPGVKETRTGFDPWAERSLEERHGNPRSNYWRIPWTEEPWQVAVHELQRNQT